MYALPNSLPYVDLLPGPFILLFLIPLLPLALFSLGARPPALGSGSGSGPSPLSDELWRTTALLAGAVTVALCVGVYPDSMGDIMGWVKDGRMKVGSMAVGAGGGNWMGWGGTWTKAAVAGTGVGAGARGKRGMGMTPEMARRIIKSRKPTFDRIAANHIAAIRYYHPKLYNPSQPRLSSVVGLGLVIVLVVIITWGKVLTSIYISDKTPPPRPSSQSPSSSSSSSKSKGPSEWAMKEYGLRKKESKDATKERFKSQEKELSEKYRIKKKTMEGEGKGDEYEKYILKKSGERRKDLVDLKKMLDAKKLEPVGLEKDPGWMIKTKGSKSGNETEAKDEGKGEGEGKGKGEGKKKDEVVGKLTMGDKIRKALLGNVMAGSIKKEKAKAPSTSVPEVVAVQPVAARGPGWEVADTPAAEVALAKSAGAAEALARGMGK